MKKLLLLALVACGPRPMAHDTHVASGSDTADDQPTAVDPEPAGNGRVDPDNPPPASSDSDLPAAMQTILDDSNKDRAQHCAAPLEWSAKLADVAQKWADHLRDAGCAFDHSTTDYGENLAGGTTGYLTPEGVVAMWYDEKKDYDFKSGGFGEDTGHFTQLVWKATQRVGCGMSQCNGNDIWVCNYDPAGNVDDEYRDNVMPTSCH